MTLSKTGLLNAKLWEKLNKKGTVGLVKRCEQIETGAQYAVKIIQTRDDEMLLNMKNEFRHLCKLKNENVIKVYELIVDKRNGTVYLIMEFFKGKELFVLLTEIGHYDGLVKRRSC